MIMIKYTGRRACGKTFMAMETFKSILGKRKGLLITESYMRSKLLKDTYKLPDNVDIHSVNMPLTNLEDIYEAILLDDYTYEYSKMKWTLVPRCNFMIITQFNAGEIRTYIERLDENGNKEQE